jgi:hypothetical protein
LIRPPDCQILAAPGAGAVWIGFLTAFYLLWAALIVLRCGPSLGPERRE